MARYALTVAYDGSCFSGWQTQPDATAAQDVLERALSAVAGESIRTVCAGRTDAGVHALRQVVHFDSAAQRPLTAWIRGTNAHLPAALAVRSAAAVPDSFHARYGAARRRYRYLLYRSPVRHPLLAQRAGWTFREIDVERMRAAAAALVGEHDFSAFRSAQCQAASPVRRLEELSLCERGPFVVFTFVANAFLHHMIRNIVGSLLAVGEGRQPVSWPAEVLAAGLRDSAVTVAPAHGLTLEEVAYPPDADLGSRADEARRIRARG